MGILSREKDPALIEANRAKLLNLLKERHRRRPVAVSLAVAKSPTMGSE
jgi:hypothetical protein